MSGISSSISRRLGWSNLLLLALFPLPLAAQFPTVKYEAQAGSVIRDECVFCDRAPLDIPLRGTFTLTQLPVKILGELYSMEEIRLDCASCEVDPAFFISGAGRLHRPNFESQSVTLELTVNGVGSVVLASLEEPSAAPWPTLDFTVTEDGARDPGHKYTLHLLATPTVELVDYEIVPGNLDDDSGTIIQTICPACRLFNPNVPLGGSLKVGLVKGTVDGINLYSLNEIQMTSLLPGRDMKVVGSGSYEEGGDVEQLKRIRLSLAVDDLHVRVFRGGPEPLKGGAAFPNIDIEATEIVREGLWYQIHLVAKPVGGGSAKFRRGDSNADGAVDIADAIYHLSWQFLGGPQPTCLDAADSDKDGVHNLTDAVFTLQFLFSGGTEPPPPGPRECGEDATGVFGCEAYGSC
jgi:hypothetical protein